MKRFLILLAMVLVAGLPLFTTACNQDNNLENAIEDTGDALQNLGEAVQQEAEEAVEEVQEEMP